MSNKEAETLDRLYRKHKSVHRVGAIVGLSGETVRKRMVGYGLKITKTDWSQQDEDRVVEYYKTTPRSKFDLRDLARILGRPYYGVAMKASRMGLGDMCAPKKKKPKRVIEKTLPWSRWTKHQHPRGMLGKKHTEENKKKQSEFSKRMWQDMRASGTALMSEENRQRRSDQQSARNYARMKSGHHHYSRCRRGKRADLDNAYFASSWEANVARHLNLLKSLRQIVDWKYEPDTFWFEKIKRGVRSYTPDFRVWEPDGTDHYIEVKGWMDPKSKTKLRRMKKYHPTIRIRVIGEKEYRVLCKTSSPLIPEWERDKWMK